MPAPQLPAAPRTKTGGVSASTSSMGSSSPVSRQTAPRRSASAALFRRRCQQGRRQWRARRDNGEAGDIDKAGSSGEAGEPIEGDDESDVLLAGQYTKCD